MRFRRWRWKNGSLIIIRQVVTKLIISFVFFPFQRLLLALQVTVAVMIAGGCFFLPFSAIRDKFEDTYFFSTSIQGFLIVVNVVTRDIIYRKSKLIAETVVSYQSDDIDLQLSQSENVTVIIRKKITTSFELVAIMSSLLCLPNLLLFVFFLTHDYESPGFSQCFLGFLLELIELASVNCVINPFIYYATSYKYKTAVKIVIRIVSFDFFCGNENSS